MKVLNQENTGELDKRTMKFLGISSFQLMEKAVYALYRQLKDTVKDVDRPFVILAGSGNNGGDGIGLARLLSEDGHIVELYYCDYAQPTDENSKMRSKLPRRKYLTESTIHSESDFPNLPNNSIVIDAIFGNGINRPLSGLWLHLVKHVNSHSESVTVISIDIPSGLHPDSWYGTEAVKADFTFTIGQPKKSFFYSESGEYTGEWDIVDIGLSYSETKDLHTNLFYVTKALVQSSVNLKRKKFSHKGIYGHALLINGSYGKMGAAILAARSCLRSGVGLLTCHVPKIGYPIMQISVPEAMVSVDDHDYYFHSCIDTQKYSAIGIGSGIDHRSGVEEALLYILKQSKKPLVLDADALNIIASKEDWIQAIPADSIITPHPGEFRRLFGSWESDEEKLNIQLTISKEHHIYIVLKGAHTSISTPDGRIFFNSTGNPGMATPGSGDTLTGILTSFRAQGIPPLAACLTGVYLHGMAGDLASKDKGEISLISSDIIDYLGSAFQDTFGY